MPSLPSALARMSAMRRAVSARSSALISRPATSRTSCLQARVAIGPLATIAVVKRRRPRRSPPPRTISCAKPQRLRLGGAEALGGDEVASRRLLAEGADDVRADRRRQQAEARFAERERHAVGDDADVAHRGEAQAAGVAVAVDARDHRHRAAVHRPQHLGERARVGVVLLPGEVAGLAHEGEVGAGAERLAAAAEDDRADVGVAGERAERRRQLADERAVDGVAHLGAVEPDAGHRPVAFDPQRRRHAPLAPGSRPAASTPSRSRARVAHRGDRRGDLAAVVGGVVEDVAERRRERQRLGDAAWWSCSRAFAGEARVVERAISVCQRGTAASRRSRSAARSRSSSASSATLFETPSAKRGNQTRMLGDEQVVQRAVHALEEEPASLR